MGRKSVKSVLWVSADGLRVVDDKTKVGACEGGSRHQWATILSVLEWAKDAFPPTSGISLPQRPSRLCHGLLEHLGTLHSHNSGLGPVVICELA